MTPWIDAAGTAHATATEARIVCLVPSLTELLCDLGLASQLVGRTGFCIHPREALRSVAKVGGTKDVDFDKVRALEPTHVIVNIDENTRESAERLAQCVPNLIVTHPLAPLDNPPLYRLLGGIFGRSAEAEALALRFDVALQTFQATQTADHGARLERTHQLAEIGDRPGPAVADPQRHRRRFDRALRSEDDGVRTGGCAQLDRVLAPVGIVPRSGHTRPEDPRRTPAAGLRIRPRAALNAECDPRGSR